MVDHSETVSAHVVIASDAVVFTEGVYSTLIANANIALFFHKVASWTGGTTSAEVEVAVLFAGYSTLAAHRVAIIAPENSVLAIRDARLRYFLLSFVVCGKDVSIFASHRQ